MHPVCQWAWYQVIDPLSHIWQTLPSTGPLASALLLQNSPVPCQANHQLFIHFCHLFPPWGYPLELKTFNLWSAPCNPVSPSTVSHDARLISCHQQIVPSTGTSPEPTIGLQTAQYQAKAPSGNPMFLPSSTPWRMLSCNCSNSCTWPIMEI